MAITLNDFKERLENIALDLDDMDFGRAKTRITNLITLIETSGIVIHAVVTTADKKVESNDNTEE